ncbi:syntaxin-7 [Microplitis mediator]|uniref:syntaxin-7 n=1 Tax=Microplitis mediator TaxID=375433 RepID=UPI00255389A2|nr:syntaxin-7 [Microplitis mediator]XP_057341361.1 syntaxin-7 [Microplitis mediator]
MAYMGHNYGSTDQRTVPDVGFSPTELYNLSENITSHIYAINASWKDMERAAKHIGTKRDTRGLREQVQATQRTTNNIVTQTSRDIARIAVLMKRGDKEQKLQIEKLTTDFKDALRRYSDMQQTVLQLMKRHVLQDVDFDNYNFESDEDIGEQKEWALQDSLQRHEQRVLEFERGMLLEREDLLNKLEGDILDVNQIMRELGALVNQQGGSIDTIENSIENVYGNVGLGAQELSRASGYQNKYRKKLLFILLLALVIVIILIVVLVTKYS